MAKMLVIGSEERVRSNLPDLSIARQSEIAVVPRGASAEEVLAAGSDADFVLADAISPVTAELMARMPRLKMVQSEGVAYNAIDTKYAAEQGIYVCNNAGCNAAPVAELSVTLMSMLLHRTLWGHRMVLSGRQLEAQQELDCHAPLDLALAKVGLIGFGAIAQATAERLRPYGSRVYYYARHRREAETERAYGVEYLPLYELAETCDFISLHLPATAESHHLLDQTFFDHVKPGAYLVNTARGAVIDDEALAAAIRSGRLAGAALDAYEPEPVEADHPLVVLAREFPDRVVLCPHQGGIAQSAYRNVYRMLFENLKRIMDGQRPERIVNGL